jgi:hypothetical protein
MFKDSATAPITSAASSARQSGFIARATIMDAAKRIGSAALPTVPPSSAAKGWPRHKKMSAIIPMNSPIGGSNAKFCNNFTITVPLPMSARAAKSCGVAQVAGPGMNVEVIEVVSQGPSAFHEVLRADGQPVLHHCATFAADYEGTRDHFVAQGFPVVSEFGFAGHRICYVDTRPLLGFMTEVYPELPIIRAMYAETVESTKARPGDPAISPWMSLG